MKVLGKVYQDFEWNIEKLLGSFGQILRKSEGIFNGCDIAKIMCQDFRIFIKIFLGDYKFMTYARGFLPSSWDSHSVFS